MFDQVSLTKFEQRYLYSDRVTIKDNKTKKAIASNQRLMHFFYTLAPDFVGGRCYLPEALCGKSHIYGFDENVFTFYRNVKWQPAHIGINRDIFKKYN